jgi:hypothetical protein
VHWPELAVISIGVLTAIVFGAQVDWREFLKMEIVVCIVGSVFILWGLALLLTIVDHFRYRGWELSGDESANAVAQGFVLAVLESQTAAAYHYCAKELRIRCSTREFEHRVQNVLKELGVVAGVMQLDVPGRFRLPLLQRAARTLNDIDDAGLNAVALVLLQPTGEDEAPTPVPTIQISLQHDGDGWGVLDFHVITIAWR